MSCQRQQSLGPLADLYGSFSANLRVSAATETIIATQAAASLVSVMVHLPCGATLPELAKSPAHDKPDCAGTCLLDGPCSTAHSGKTAGDVRAVLSGWLRAVAVACSWAPASTGTSRHALSRWPDSAGGCDPCFVLLCCSGGCLRALIVTDRAYRGDRPWGRLLATPRPPPAPTLSPAQAG